jgi:hypothetical protein
MTRKLHIVEKSPHALWDAFDTVLGEGFFNRVIEEKILGG